MAILLLGHHFNLIANFYGTLKYSNIYISNYQSIKKLKEGVKEYMNKYNFKIFHSSIRYKQPMNYCLDFSIHYRGIKPLFIYNLNRLFHITI